MPDAGWSYLAGALAFAGLETAFAWWTGRALGITSHLILLPVAFPRLGPPTVLAGTVFVAGIVLGGALAAWRNGEWRWRPLRSASQVLVALAGGFLMGVGARLAPGCNVGGVVGGIASSSLHGWVEGVFVLVGGAVGLSLAAPRRVARRLP